MKQAKMLIALIVIFPFFVGQANANPQFFENKTDAASPSLMCKHSAFTPCLAVNDVSPLSEERLSFFKDYVINYTLSQHLPLPYTGTQGTLRKSLPAIIEDNTFLYTDTMAHALPCQLNLLLNKQGRIKDCRVEGNVCPQLAERIEKIVLSYPEKIVDKKEWKVLECPNIKVDLSIPFDGNYVFLNSGLEKLIAVLRDFARSLEACHPLQNPDRGPSSRNDNFPMILSGKLRMGFMVQENGAVGMYQRMLDSIFPEHVYETYMRRINHYGYYSEGTVDVAMLNGETMPVWVEVNYDFDEMMFSFKCYMVKENE